MLFYVSSGQTIMTPAEESLKRSPTAKTLSQNPDPEFRLYQTFQLFDQLLQHAKSLDNRVRLRHVYPGQFEQIGGIH